MPRSTAVSFCCKGYISMMITKVLHVDADADLDTDTDKNTGVIAILD